jgi:pimeloyl-ACP methyl ester carboxylesterase
MDKVIYMLSGLGVDQRVLARLKVEDYEMRYLPWLLPKKREAMAAYAARMSAMIEHDNPILLGLSFGGMMAIEIAKIRPIQQIFLISSAKTHRELPWYFKLAGRLHLHRLVPSFLLKRTNPITYWLFGVKTKESKALLTAILKDTDSQFIRWAIPQILFWKNETALENSTIQLHGKADRLLLASGLKSPDHLIPKAGHFMIWEQAEELNGILGSYLD